MIAGENNSSPSEESLPPSHESAAFSNWMLVAMIEGAALLLVVIGGAVGYLVFDIVGSIADLKIMRRRVGRTFDPGQKRAQRHFGVQIVHFFSDVNNWKRGILNMTIRLINVEA
ncbi:uncharacterized protein PHALS_03748 [Plasmopara halstedii]|uniref:Uncharacterized protein n=1 Tax=Plasmopara halstedii TaxID=4781 RepID=A0A0P1B0R0_PLAHL|nr:uncharacterized protein PHALS_03748 [Plasmopara halstedii]CEG47093.1 hypothetical protein PHALS_03748 [Plasmopara halstedii]|eukprot:XP_024583462.1 hypothetical protein PHALS_03748 [Plasmopara halstedii]